MASEKQIPSSETPNSKVVSPSEKTVCQDSLEQWSDLVWYVVNRIKGRLPASVSEEELFSAGQIGLWSASQSYDQEQGASFKTYAYHRIRGAILDELRRLDFLPRTQREKAKREGVDAPSFSSLPTDENGNERLAANEVAAECENQELIEIMREKILDLPEKMRAVMSLYYQDGLKMRAIAAQLNLTESRVSQIHTNAVARLKLMMGGNEQ